MNFHKNIMVSTRPKFEFGDFLGARGNPKIGSRRWNWEFRESFFLNPNPDFLFHSSYSFWLWLSTSGSGWDLACSLPWKKCEKSLFLYFSHFFEIQNRDSDLKKSFPGILNFNDGILPYEDVSDWISDFFFWKNKTFIDFWAIFNPILPRIGTFSGQTKSTTWKSIPKLTKLEGIIFSKKKIPQIRWIFSMWITRYFSRWKW